MTGDWLKVYSDLAKHPKICQMADFLSERICADLLLGLPDRHSKKGNALRNVMRNASVGACVTLWGTLRHRGYRVGTDLVVDRMTKTTVDMIADLEFFGEAMEQCGWLVFTEESVRLPRFYEDLNHDYDEQRKKNAERQKRYRERKKTVTLRNAPREEKEKRRDKRKETKERAAGPPVFEPRKEFLPHRGEDFLAAWLMWCDHRMEIKKPLTRQAVTQQLKRLGEMTLERAVRTIEHTVANGWVGLREPEPSRLVSGSEAAKAEDRERAKNYKAEWMRKVGKDREAG